MTSEPENHRSTGPEREPRPPVDEAPADDTVSLPGGEPSERPIEPAEQADLTDTTSPTDLTDTTAPADLTDTTGPEDRSGVTAATDEAPPADGTASAGEAASADETTPADEPLSGVGGTTAPPAAGPTPPPYGPPVSDLPPFGGFRAPPPPPGTSGYATRFGLVRSVHDRYIAGVCGALARATNTDPVLWRVGLPVLTLVGGLGALIYLLGWLLIPAEGESASPIEALAGRGWSSTSRGMTIALAIITLILGVNTVSDGFGGGRLVTLAIIVAGLAVLGGAFTAQRGPGQPGESRWRRPPAPPTPGATWAPGQAWPPAGTPAWMPGQPGPSAETPAWSSGTPASGPLWTGPMTPGTPTDTLSDHPLASEPPTDPSTTATPGPDVTGYRPPFAPYGPYASTSGAYSQYHPYTVDFPGLSTPQPAPVPRPSRRSPARQIILSAAFLVTGVIAILDLTNAVSVPASSYFAAALATIGLGLLLGSFFGRIRGPITLGVLLVFALVASSTFGAFRTRHGDANYLVRPASLATLDGSYSESIGRLTVDLRQVDFGTANTSLDLHMDAGQIRVILPADVDVDLFSSVDVGNTQLGRQHQGGINRGPTEFQDDGADGPGGGHLRINATVNVGSVEVTR